MDHPAFASVAETMAIETACPNTTPAAQITSTTALDLDGDCAVIQPQRTLRRPFGFPPADPSSHNMQIKEDGSMTALTRGQIRTVRSSPRSYRSVGRRGRARIPPCRTDQRSDAGVPLTRWDLKTRGLRTLLGSGQQAKPGSRERDQLCFRVVSDHDHGFVSALFGKVDVVGEDGGPEPLLSVALDDQFECGSKRVANA